MEPPILSLDVRFLEDRDISNPSTKYGHVDAVIQYFCPADGTLEDHMQGVAESESELSRFHIRCTIDRENIYAWTYFYDFYHTEEDDAETALRVFKRIRFGIDKHVKHYGRIETFGQYVAVIARILKINNIALDYGKKSESSGNRYQCMDAGAAADSINSRIRFKMQDWVGNRWEEER